MQEREGNGGRKDGVSRPYEGLHGTQKNATERDFLEDSRGQQDKEPCGRIHASQRGLQLPFEERRVDGLVLLSYPLHRPGAPDLEVRSTHFPQIECPVLLLSGESDPFARIDLLREAVRRLRAAELVTWPKLGHGLGRVQAEALDRIAAFVGSLA